MLLAADKGEGLFFAGSSHIAIKIVASEAEHRLVTTNPAELLKLKEEQEAMGSGNLQETKPQYKPLERLVNTPPVKPEMPEAQEIPETQEQRSPEQRPEQPSEQSPTQGESEIVMQPPKVVKQPLDEVEEPGPSENEEEVKEIPGVKEDRNKMEEQMRGPSRPAYLDTQNQGNEPEGQGGNQNNNQNNNPPERRDGTFTIGNRPLQGDIPTSDNQNQ